MLPLILEEGLEVFNDPYSKLVVTLFEEFDFDGALKECKNIKKDAENDIVLREIAKEVEEAAYKMIYIS